MSVLILFLSVYWFYINVFLKTTASYNGELTICYKTLGGILLTLLKGEIVRLLKPLNFASQDE